MIELPEILLGCMADAMLDPDLRAKGFVTLPSGNVVRIKVLMRALEAAEALGWRLVPTKVPLPCRPAAALDEMAAAVGPPPQPTEDDACTS
jgi:hypothetical protein